MKPSPFRFLAAAAMLALGLTRFAAAADKDDMERAADRVRSGPKAAPVQNDTSFAAGLKCMDNLFRSYGVHNVSVVIDEIPDATKKVNVGARDMFISATSQMTRASHAVRLIPVVDSKVFSESKRQRVVADSDFVIQGSISQFDDSMLQKQRDGAVCLWYLCIGAADSDTFSGLGLDLNLVETSGMTLVPGANVRNAVLIRKHGKGFDGDLTIKKFSTQYNFTLVSSDGNGQALRTLVDLGAIEMYGRLLKLPYWSCLGVTDEDPDVKAEINDWWEEMAGDEHDHRRLLAWLQIQMRAQGLYAGDITGRPDAALLRAVRAYRMALGQPDDLNLNAAFLRRYLEADHYEVRKVAAARLEEIAQKEGPLPPPVAAAPPVQGPQQPGPGASAPAAANDAAPASTTPGPAAANVAPATPGAVNAKVAAANPAAPAAPGSAPSSAGAPATTAPIAHNSSPAAPAPAGTPQAATPAPTSSATQLPNAHVAAEAPDAHAPPAAGQPAGAQPAVYRPSAPVTTIRIEGTRPANKSAYKPGEAFYVGVMPSHSGYLYCYLVEDQQKVSLIHSNSTQTGVHVSAGALSVFPSDAAAPLVAGRSGHRQDVACFSSAKDLGKAPLDVAGLHGGIDALRARFATATGGNYEHGVFNVKTQ
jgi:hypothetical protein